MFEVAARAAKYSAVTGLFGMGFGGVLAYLRFQSVPLYATTMGLNYLIFGGTFFFMRETLMAWDPSVPMLNSSMAGSVAGGLLTTAFSGPMRGLQGAVFWGMVAAVGQAAVDEWYRPRSRASDPMQRPSEESSWSDYVRPRATAVQEATAGQDTTAYDHDTSDITATGNPDVDWETSVVDPERRLIPWLPNWFPFKLLSEDEYEDRLRKRLARIDRALRRDDAYRMLVEHEVAKYDEAEQRRHDRAAVVRNHGSSVER